MLSPVVIQHAIGELYRRVHRSLMPDNDPHEIVISRPQHTLPGPDALCSRGGDQQFHKLKIKCETINSKNSKN